MTQTARFHVGLCAEPRARAWERAKSYAEDRLIAPRAKRIRGALFHASDDASTWLDRRRMPVLLRLMQRTLARLPSPPPPRPRGS